MTKTYRVRPDITPEQIEMAISALNPFYGFGAVLETANEDRGSICICLHDGENNQKIIGELSLNEIDPEGEIISICGSWERVPASYVGPTLKAKDFFAARDAFMACIESLKNGSSEP